MYRPQADRDSISNLALSFGLSLVLLPCLALILDALPWGISLWSVMVGNLVVILLLMAGTLLRQRSLPPDARFEPLQQLHPRQAWGTLEGRYRAAYIFIAVLVLGFAVLAYTIIALPSPAERMTEFYILGDEGMAEGYPHQLAVGEPFEITIGVRNLEGEDLDYHVEAWGASGLIGVVLDPESLFSFQASSVSMSPCSAMATWSPWRPWRNARRAWVMCWRLLARPPTN